MDIPELILETQFLLPQGMDTMMDMFQLLFTETPMKTKPMPTMVGMTSLPMVMGMLQRSDTHMLTTLIMFCINIPESSINKVAVTALITGGGGCYISNAADQNFACQCSYVGFWTCLGSQVRCNSNNAILRQSRLVLFGLPRGPGGLWWILLRRTVSIWFRLYHLPLITILWFFVVLWLWIILYKCIHIF